MTEGEVWEMLAQAEHEAKIKSIQVKLDVVKEQEAKARARSPFKRLAIALTLLSGVVGVVASAKGDGEKSSPNSAAQSP